MARTAGRLLLTAAFAAAGLTGGCATSLPPSAFTGDRPSMRPEAFFAGETRSTGVLESAAGAPLRRFHVEGHGHALPDGRFQLDQTVSMEGETDCSRTWIIGATDAHHYVASLSDASGPVRGEAYGNLFHVTYAVRGAPLTTMEQWLYLQPDGQTVLNEAVVRVAGVPVRRLSERISATDR